MFHNLRFELLEARQMLSATSWQASSGDWADAANWTNGVPTSTSTVTIDPPASATITIQPGEADAAQSLTVGNNASLDLAGGGDPTNPLSNLIVNNPGFESPVASNDTTHPSAWSCRGSSYISQIYAYTGSQSLVLSGSDSGAYKSISVTPGNSYTESVYAMTPFPLTGGLEAELQLLYYNSSGTQISSYSAPNQIVVLDSSSAPGGPLAGSVGSSGWNHFYTTAIAPSNAATARVELSTYAASGSSPGGFVYFDAMQFGPAAAGASTLTIGALASATGTLSNSGAISIGPLNNVTVYGDFTQASAGTLDIQFGGAPSTEIFGSLTISSGTPILAGAGEATLAGTLQADVVYSYAPTTTDVFIPVTFDSESGNFASYVLPSGTGYQFAGATTFTNVTLSTAPSMAVSATVSAASNLQNVPTNFLGVNIDYYDASLEPSRNTQTQQLVTAAGLSAFRFPAAGNSDQFHFNVKDNVDDTGAVTIPTFAQIISSYGGTGLVTVDYGSGSPQEAAAELAYFDGSPSDTTTIGNGIEWNTSTSQWQTVNWQTVGYWASLRAAQPLTHDDGLNFMRIGQAAPFTDVKYWEIGNEQYLGGATDHHGTPLPNGTGTGVQHDPATYATFASQFAKLAREIQASAGLPPIDIGIDGEPTDDYDWTASVLTNDLSMGFVPGFISDHNYADGPSDSSLLNDTVTDPNSNYLDWTTRYNIYQNMLYNTLGSQGASVQILATEFNDTRSNGNKQLTSLVDGLFVANSLGSLLTSGYSGGYLFALHNGYGSKTQTDSGNQLYGWREGSDYGALGDTHDGAAPTTGTNIPYPSYFALQLSSKLLGDGGDVVEATSSYSDLVVYAVRQTDGDLDLMVINTNPAANLTGQFNIAGFQPSSTATVWQYGETQDTEQSQSLDGINIYQNGVNTGVPIGLANSTTLLTLSGSSFGYNFPAYSMTVLDLTPAQTPTSISVAAALNNLATTGAEQFAATALDQSNNPLSTQPGFSWSVVGGGLIDPNGNYMPPYVPGSATIYASSGGVTGSATATYPGYAQWNSATAGSWESNNWVGSASGAAISLPGLRDVVGDTALFASAGTTVSLNDVYPNLGGMTFDSTTSYTIATGTAGDIELNNGASQATLTVSVGSDTIATPLVLLSDVDVIPAANTALSISSTVSDSGSLTVDGPGVLTLSGSNSYSGGTVVLAGTLVLAGAGALPVGSSLIIGASPPSPFFAMASPVAFTPGTVAASEASTPTKIVNVVTSALPATSAMAYPSREFREHAQEFSFGRPLVSVAKGLPASAAPAILLRSGRNAVFASERSTIDQTTLMANIAQSAHSWAWLAAIENVSETSDRNKRTDWAVAALDAVLARFGV
jgi:alpha-L-arabinofuranosidase